MASKQPLRIGYVPEHFSTPLHFAQKYHGLDAALVPFPSGTGHMITSLQSNDIDIGIGLTEAWISGLGKAYTARRDAGYQLIGRYVETPLCWAISTGARRDDVTSIARLQGKKLGVSRVGSGSYVMGYVLADTHGWLSSDSSVAPFEVIPLQTFDKLRAAVNDTSVDFFMWEHFTTKRYYDSGELKRVGEIYTPWASWDIVARPELVEGKDERLEGFVEKLNRGVAYFDGHQEEAVEYISTELDYSEADAREWLKTVKFASDVKGVEKSTVQKVVDTLKKAGVLEQNVGAEAVDTMAAIQRPE